MSGRLADVWRHIRSSLFDRQHHNGHDDGDSDTGQNTQGARTNKLIRILQVLGGKTRKALFEKIADVKPETETDTWMGHLCCVVTVRREKCIFLIKSLGGVSTE